MGDQEGRAGEAKKVTSDLPKHTQKHHKGDQAEKRSKPVYQMHSEDILEEIPRTNETASEVLGTNESIKVH